MKLNSFSKGDSANPAVILVHGFLGAGRNLYKLAEKIASEGFFVVAYDQRGHGHSEHGPVEEYRIETLANDLKQILDEYKIKKAHLIGHSLGGRVVLASASTFPERTLSLSMLDVSTHIHPESYKNIHGIIFSLNDSYATKEEAEEHLDHFESSLKAFLLSNLRQRDGKLRWIFDIHGLKEGLLTVLQTDQTTAFKNITCPILILRGDKSTHFREDELQGMLALNKNAKAKIISNAGHWLHADNFTETVNALLEFLKSLT